MINNVNSTLIALSNGGCAPWDLLCHLRSFINWLLQQLAEGFRSAANTLINAVVTPTVKVSLALPTFTNQSSLEPYVFSSMSQPMSVIYPILLYASYGIVLGAIVLAVIWVFAETADIVRRGEGFSTIKKSLIVLALLPFLPRIYDYAVIGLASLNMMILPKEVIASFIGTFTSITLLLLSVGALLAGIAVLVPAILFILIMLLLGAMRVLLTAALAIALPLALALSLIPVRFVREVGMHMISMLVNLMMSTVLASILLRLGAEVGAILGPTLSSGKFVEAVMLFFMMLATLATPAIALVMAPRAGIALIATSYFLGYMARPAIQAALRLRGALGTVFGALPHTSRVVRYTRVLRHGAAPWIASRIARYSSPKASPPSPTAPINEEDWWGE
mgnify:CR=1 FL=1